MRRLTLCLLLAACASPPRSDYVPGGHGLPRAARREYRRAVDLERHGNLRGSLEALGDLCSRYPLRLGLHLRRLELARRVEGMAKAAQLYQPPPPGVDPSRAEILAKLVRLPEEDVAARGALLEAATAEEPGEPFWRLGLADVGVSAFDLVMARARRQRELGRVQEAATSRQEAVRLLEQARQNAETALQLDPRFKEAQLLLGYIATRRADEAPDIELRDAWRKTAGYHYREALKLDRESLTALLDLSENLLYFDKYTEAARLLHRAVRLAPSEPMAWNNLGFAYYATGRLANAVRCYQRALEIDPAQARIRTALADGLRRQGKAVAALQELERARSDASGDRKLLAAIAFKMGAIEEHLGNYRPSVREYRRHIDLGGQDAAKARSRIRDIYENAFEK